MRLTKQEQLSIKETFVEIFSKGSIYLFGSRVDDAKRGGDIDLYIQLEEAQPFSGIYDKKIEFLGRLQSRIGEQKIDVVISKDINRAIEQEALKNGIEL